MGILSRLFQPSSHVNASWIIEGPEDGKREDAKMREYMPLSDTLRLYAGWLLAWYFLIYGIGAYQYTRTLPWQSALLDQLFFSPLILHFSFLAFLYVLGSAVHAYLGRRAVTGMAILVIGVVLYVVFRANT